MNKKHILFLSRLIFGCVFVFSGFVKAIDPLGFTYKMEDYLQAMGPFMEQFSSLAFVAAITLSAVELVIGINFLLGVRLKETSWIAALFMAVMTPLTLWIAIKNPVTDCGCFGDALIIGNWTTFWKNIALDAILVVIFLLMKYHKKHFSTIAQWILVIYAFLFSCGLSLYALKHLPPVDFRPYKIGNNLLKEMEIPENAPVDSFDVKLIYAKDGVEKEFTMQDYPKGDSTWTFVDQKTVLVKEGYKPPIHDFSITTEDGEITDLVLENPGYTFLLISPDLTKANVKRSDELNQIYDYAEQNGYGFIMLTASVEDDMEAYRAATGAKYPIATTDKTTLKTIIRANPGLMLIKDAIVLNKWHTSDLPVFSEKLENSPLGTEKDTNIPEHILWIALLFAIPVVIILAIDKVITNKNRD
jgi:uncharacterized membrane protein YphA (DoxX/SURF4 family)